MFFLPMPINTQNKVDLRYTVHKPLKRPNLPRNLLTMATHADFDKLSEEGSEIHQIFSIGQVCHQRLQAMNWPLGGAVL